MSALTPEDQRVSLDKLVAGLQERSFFGKVELDMQGGNILRAVLHESIKLEEPTDVEQSHQEDEAADQQAQEATAQT